MVRELLGFIPFDSQLGCGASYFEVELGLGVDGLLLGRGWVDDGHGHVVEFGQVLVCLEFSYLFDFQ